VAQYRGAVRGEKRYSITHLSQIKHDIILQIYLCEPMTITCKEHIDQKKKVLMQVGKDVQEKRVSRKTFYMLIMS